MDQTELRQLIAAILEEEANAVVDWERVDALSEELSQRLQQEPETQVPDAIYHFLDDADVRQKDAKYASYQRDLARRYVDTGEMVEHAPSAPWWSCLPTFALSAALLLWWLW